MVTSQFITTSLSLSLSLSLLLPRLLPWCARKSKHTMGKRMEGVWETIARLEKRNLIFYQLKLRIVSFGTFLPFLCHDDDVDDDDDDDDDDGFSTPSAKSKTARKKKQNSDPDMISFLALFVFSKMVLALIFVFEAASDSKTNAKKSLAIFFSIQGARFHFSPRLMANHLKFRHWSITRMQQLLLAFAKQGFESYLAARSSCLCLVFATKDSLLPWLKSPSEMASIDSLHQAGLASSPGTKTLLSRFGPRNCKTGSCWTKANLTQQLLSCQKLSGGVLVVHSFYDPRYFFLAGVRSRFNQLFWVLRFRYWCAVDLVSWPSANFSP